MKKQPPTLEVLEAQTASLTAENIKLSADISEQAQLADIGELAGEVTHKFNNFLNSLLLKITLLEAELPEIVAGRFTDLKKQARRMADLIRQVHQYRPRPNTNQVQDLNVAVQAALQALKDINITRVDLCPQPALVAGSALDYERLSSFLLGKKPSSSKGLVTIRTEILNERVRLTFEDSRLRAPANLVADIFDTDIPDLDIARKLELATCKALVRRLQGKIEAAPLADQGAVICIYFPLAKPKEAAVS